MRFLAAGSTHDGQKRDHNEDSFLVDLAHGVFVVADGMGGHKHGEVASAIAIKSFQSTVAAFDDSDVTAPWHFDEKLTEDANLINGCIQWANMEIRNLSKAEAEDGDEDPKSMGTTVVSMRVGKTKVTYAHVGDSRIYMLRDGKLVPLTKDHSAVQEMIDAGYPEDKVHQLNIKNIITRACGLVDNLKVTIADVEPQSGDKFLLCSDGLTNEIPDPSLELLMNLPVGPGQTVDMMIEAANAHGGNDNITAVVVCIL